MRRNPTPTNPRAAIVGPMSGRKVLVTGGTSGVGRAAAMALGAMGAELLFVSRDAARGDRVVKQLRLSGARSELFVCDLARQHDVRLLARRVAIAYPTLDVLVNNAGFLPARREVTEDGVERTLAVNHLAPFLLTTLLLPSLRCSTQGRVVTLSSEAHRVARPEMLDDLQSERRFTPFRTYALTKVANVLFTRELARREREAGSRVTANAVHPGTVNTGFGADAEGMPKLALAIARPFMLTPEQGAEAPVWLASAPEVAEVTGAYFDKRRRREPSALARDDAAARRLWDRSERLVAGSETLETDA